MPNFPELFSRFSLQSIRFDCDKLQLIVFLSHRTVLVGILSLLLCVCTVTDFSAAEKDIGVKLRVLVRLLPGQVFSHFGELWPRDGFPKSPKHEAR